MIAAVMLMSVALVFAAPAAIAGYALVYGVTHEAIPSAIWRQIFCFIGGALVGVSALMRTREPAWLTKQQPEALEAADAEDAAE